MKRVAIATVVTLAMCAAPATALAGDTDVSQGTPDQVTQQTDTTQKPAEPTQTTTDTSTTTDTTQTTDTSTSDTDTSTTTDTPDKPTDPPPCTENCNTDPPPCTVDCGGTPACIDCDLPELPSNDPCIDDIAACDTGVVAGQGVGPAVASGRALPFTGIEDVVLPLLIGMIVLAAGVIAYRYAAAKETLNALRELARRRTVERGTSGYSHALRNQDADQIAQRFWEDRQRSAA